MRACAMRRFICVSNPGYVVYTIYDYTMSYLQVGFKARNDAIKPIQERPRVYTDFASFVEHPKEV